MSDILCLEFGGSYVGVCWHRLYEPAACGLRLASGCSLLAACDSPLIVCDSLCLEFEAHINMSVLAGHRRRTWSLMTRLVVLCTNDDSDDRKSRFCNGK